MDHPSGGHDLHQFEAALTMEANTVSDAVYRAVREEALRIAYGGECTPQAAKRYVQEAYRAAGMRPERGKMHPHIYYTEDCVALEHVPVLQGACPSELI